MNFTLSTDTRFSYSCACRSSFTDLDQSNPGRNCEAIAPCCEKMKLSKEIKSSSGSSYGVVWLICDKVKSTKEKFEYQCDENGYEVYENRFSSFTTKVVQASRKDVPSAIIYFDKFKSSNVWFAIEGQTYSQASSLQSIPFFSQNNLGEGIPEEKCWAKVGPLRNRNIFEWFRL